MDLPALPDKNETAAQDDSRLIYAASLQRAIGKKWKISSDKTQNLAKLRENARRAEDLREHQLMMADYNELAKTDYLGRLAYMIGMDRIDNLPAMLTASAVIGILSSSSEPPQAAPANEMEAIKRVEISRAFIVSSLCR